MFNVRFQRRPLVASALAKQTQALAPSLEATMLPAQALHVHDATNGLHFGNPGTPDSPNCLRCLGALHPPVYCPNPHQAKWGQKIDPEASRTPD